MVTFSTLTSIIAAVVAVSAYYRGYKSKGDLKYVWYSLGGLWGITAIDGLKRSHGCR